MYPGISCGCMGFSWFNMGIQLGFANELDMEDLPTLWQCRNVEHDDNPLGVMGYDMIFSIKETHRHVTPEFLSDDVLALFFQFLRGAGWYVSSLFLFLEVIFDSPRNTRLFEGGVPTKTWGRCEVTQNEFDQQHLAICLIFRDQNSDFPWKMGWPSSSIQNMPSRAANLHSSRCELESMAHFDGEFTL